MNWGWDGNNDGYFLFDGYFDPDEEVNPGGDYVSNENGYPAYNWRFRVITYDL